MRCFNERGGLFYASCSISRNRWERSCVFVRLIWLIPLLVSMSMLVFATLGISSPIGIVVSLQMIVSIFVPELLLLFLHLIQINVFLVHVSEIDCWWSNCYWALVSNSTYISPLVHFALSQTSTYLRATVMSRYNWTPLRTTNSIVSIMASRRSPVEQSAKIRMRSVTTQSSTNMASIAFHSECQNAWNEWVTWLADQRNSGTKHPSLMHTRTYLPQCQKPYGHLHHHSHINHKLEK